MVTTTLKTLTLLTTTFLTTLAAAQNTLVCGTGNTIICGTGMEVTANTCLDMCACAPAGSGIGMTCHGFVGCDVFTICAEQFGCECTTPPA